MAVAKPASLPVRPGALGLPESTWYSVKRRMLGPPLSSDQLQVERLSKPLGLGVLSCDGISSANYGSELILHELLPFFGMAAFTLLLPMTGVILLGVALVVLSYREVVTVYTRAGGSYVVARENFGPRVAQVAAVALMVDYVVTVAVQTAAGSQAILSTFPSLARPLGGTTTLLLIAVTATLIMCYVNLLGVRENGRIFAIPTYLFSGSVGLMIIVGLAREVSGGLPLARWQPGTVPVGHHPSGLVTFAAIYIVGRAFANGGSSLTGIEAVSNAVSALRPPEGRNARQLLVTQGAIVAFLIAGISWLAHVTHAVPYINGFPTVLSQEARLIFGQTWLGQVLFFAVQAGAISILFTGGNTSFSGFPFLTSFVAEDSFLPRWLSKRGHRLVFSNGIIMLTVLALALLLGVGANTNNLVPFYAIGVFTGFAMAGFGMARYHIRHKEPGWRRRRVINFAGGVYTALVVVIFAIVKFTEGAWLVVAVFPVLVLAFIKLSYRYRREAAAAEALGGDSRRPAELPAPGRARPDRRPRPRSHLRTALRPQPASHGTARRAFRPGPGPGRTAAPAVAARGPQHTARPGGMPGPPDRPGGRRAGRPAGGPARHLCHRSPPPAQHRAAAGPAAARPDRRPDRPAGVPGPEFGGHDHPLRRQRQDQREPGPGGRASRRGCHGFQQSSRRPAARPSRLHAGSRGKVTLDGRVHTIEIRKVEHSCILACTVAGASGEVTALFYGRRHIPGLVAGSHVRLRGTASTGQPGTVLINPAYELLGR